MREEGMISQPEDLKTFRIRTPYNPDLVPKLKAVAGRQWEPRLKTWRFPIDRFHEVCQVVKEFYPSIAEKMWNGDGIWRKVKEAWEKVQENIEKSSLASADIYVPVPDGLELMPFQKAGVAFAKDKKAVLLAEEMGLGKTIESLALINLWEPERVLVICPASLKINWEKECKKWLVHPYKVIRIDSPGDFPENPPSQSIIIINYDKLRNFVETYKEEGKHGITKKKWRLKPYLDREWDLVIVDEVHKAKNPKAQRSRYTYAILNRAKRKLLLTGTPIINRPIELYPILKSLDSETWGNFWEYATHYCAAHKTRWGWDFTGASNLDELHERLRATVMVRRLKKDVLKELPPKRRQTIELSLNGDSKLKEAIKNEKEIWNRVELAMKILEDDSWKEKAREMKVKVPSLFDELSKIRHQTALAKVPQVIQFIEEILESKDKVVVFAHHKDVISQIADHFNEISVTLTGGDSLEKRQRAIDTFQENPNIRVFVGSIQAAGVGITLTAADTVVFAELDWVPGNISQAEDRVHRKGQLNSVLIYYLVAEESIDAYLAQVLVKKMGIIEQAIDGEVND